MSKVIGNTTATTMPPPALDNKVDKADYDLFVGDVCSELLRLEDNNVDKEYLQRVIDGFQSDNDHIWDKIYIIESDKADKTTVEKSTNSAYSFEFSATDNKEVRLGEVSSISFTFGNGEYSDTYTSGLSFDSGATPTAIDYTDSGILNWVGTDCTTTDGLSIFQPSANTHYDIVFYFNGTQFIGLVNGFVPSVSR